MRGLVLVVALALACATPPKPQGARPECAPPNGCAVLTPVYVFPKVGASKE